MKYSILFYICVVISSVATTVLIQNNYSEPKVTQLKIPVNQVGINTANRKAFFDMENDPLPEPYYGEMK